MQLKENGLQRANDSDEDSESRTQGEKSHHDEGSTSNQGRRTRPDQPSPMLHAFTELAVLKVLQHPHLNGLQGWFVHQTKLYLLLEYGEKGDLKEQVNQVGRLCDDDVTFIAGSLCAALNFLHRKEFVFGDLKLENVLLFSSGKVQLADSGGIRAVSESAKAQVATSLEDIRGSLDEITQTEVEKEAEEQQEVAKQQEGGIRNVESLPLSSLSSKKKEPFTPNWNDAVRTFDAC